MAYAMVTNITKSSAKFTSHRPNRGRWDQWPLVTLGLLSLLCLAWIAGCRSALPVNGVIGGQRLISHVDRPVAQYYLNHYLAGERLDPELDNKIGGLYRTSGQELPDREALRRVSNDFSPDFASLYFADRLSRSKENQAFQIFYNKILQETRSQLSAGRVHLPDAASEYELLFVPGFLYQRNPHTGADFAASQAALNGVGIKFRFIETDEVGAIEDNATKVAKAVEAIGAEGGNLIVVSISKSGPEVALALTQLGDRRSKHIAAWLNAVGAMQGSPLADIHLLYQDDATKGTIDSNSLQSLTTGPSRQRFARLQLPPNLLVVNYIGIPVSGSLSGLARASYRQMLSRGPNDGLALLPDLLAPGGGITLMALGKDHYLLNQDIKETTIALAIALIRWLEEDKNDPVN